MIKYEINIITDNDGKLIIPDEIRKLIPKNSIVKLVIYPSGEVSVNEETNNQVDE